MHDNSPARLAQLSLTQHHKVHRALFDFCERPEAASFDTTSPNIVLGSSRSATAGSVPGERSATVIPEYVIPTDIGPGGRSVVEDSRWSQRRGYEDVGHLEAREVDLETVARASRFNLRWPTHAIPIKSLNRAAR